MAGINRTIIITGPALVEFAGQKFWSKGDVSVTPQFKRFGIETAAFGKLEERFSDKRIVVAFEPAGRFTAGLAAVLWPYGSTLIGASIYGAADRPLYIWGRDGQKITLPNASLTKMPNIRQGVDKTIVGPVEFTGLLANSADGADDADYWTAAAAAYPGDAGFDPADIITSGHWLTWNGGGAPWTAFRTEAGVEVAFNLRLQEQAVDGLGTVDMRLAGLDVTARAIPIGPTAAEAMDYLNDDSLLGAKLTGTDLVITPDQATGCITTLNNAILTDVSLRYGSAAKRIGQCTWLATRSFSAGVPDPLFTVTLPT